MTGTFKSYFVLHGVPYPQRIPEPCPYTLINPGGDPPDGSLMKCTMKHRWRELHHWDLAGHIGTYSLTATKLRGLEVDLAYWQMQPSGFTQPFTSEPTLRVPFSNADHAPITLPFEVRVLSMQKCGLKALV